MGTALLVVGIFVLLVGGLFTLGADGLSFVAALVIVLIGAVAFVGGAIVDKLESIRAKVEGPKKPPEFHV